MSMVSAINDACGVNHSLARTDKIRKAQYSEDRQMWKIMFMNTCVLNICDGNNVKTGI